MPWEQTKYGGQPEITLKPGIVTISIRGAADMTIQQEAYEKIMKLPEDGIRLILVMADEIARQHGISSKEEYETEINTSAARKKKAFQNMLKMREQSAYPKDFDYKKIMGSAIDEKYNLAN